MEVEEAMAVDICLEGLFFGTAVDVCPERMNVVDAEASLPQRTETVVECCPRMAVESRMGVEF